jgi:hypothetical protein
MRIHTARALLCALPAVATIAAAAAPAAQAAAIDRTAVETCKIYDAAGTFTTASVVIGLRVQGTLPDSVAQGSPITLSGGHATVTIPGAARAILAAFGDSFGGSVTAFNLTTTNASPATVNLAATPIPIPTLPVSTEPGQPSVSVELPTSGSLSGPLATATGAVGSSATVSLENSATAIVVARTGAATGTLNCKPTTINEDGEPISIALGSVPITAPVVVTPTAPSITKVQGTGIANIGGFGVITGQRLTGVTAVTVGGKRASNVNRIGNLITFSAPKLAAGTYDVTVTTPAGTSPASAGAKLRYIKLGF